MLVAPIYASLLALLFVYLSARVIKLRRSAQIGIGDGGDKLLMRAMRVHSNFIEYVPLTIILISLLEWQSFSAIVLHILGTTLLIGRLLHAYGVSQPKENFKFRVSGMIMTLSCILVSALILLGYSLKTGLS